MIIRPAACVFLLFSTGLLWLAGGCATTATLTALQPAQAPVIGVRRLAVLPFSGLRDLGAVAHEAVVVKLRENGYYALVDHEQLLRLGPLPLHQPDGNLNTLAAIDAARRAALDAILVGRVRALEENGAAFGGVTIRIGDPTLKVVVQFELIDVRAGAAVAQGDSERSYTGELTDDRTSSTSATQVAARLAREAAAGVVERISPHRQTLEVPLATPAFGNGVTGIHRGNRLASEGQWREAMQAWQEVLQESPDNAAALYNLGLAYEAQADHDRARQMYTAAWNVTQDDAFQQALERVAQGERDHHAALAQLSRRAQPPAAPGLPCQWTDTTPAPPNGRFPPVGWHVP